MAIMTERRKRFIVEYLVDLNATQAAIRAGYSPKTARSTGYELLNIPEIRNEIDERLKTIEESRICDVQEVMEFLTSVMRGEITEEVLVVLRVGGGKTEARLIPKGPSISGRLKAAEHLGKAYGLFSEKARVRIDGSVPVVISGASDLEDCETPFAGLTTEQLIKLADMGDDENEKKRPTRLPPPR